MPRPRKWKKVCCLPESEIFGPLTKTSIQNEVTIMKIEEYETVRLIDLEQLTQEECAEKMQVSRATVQKLYQDARAKIAESLVNGNLLRIEGGDYQLYSDSERGNCYCRCRGYRCRNDELYFQNNKEETKK
jgi:predicted DNA-binding protein (UPF0251 family)